MVKKVGVYIATQPQEESEKAKTKELAYKLREIYNAFVEAGFTEDQAWWFVGMIFDKKTS